MESVILWLPKVGAILTLIIGVIGFFKPTILTDQLDIGLNGAKAYSEMRGLMGGLNIGTGTAALLFNEPLVYMTLGLGWFMFTLARFWSMIVDRSTLKDTIPPLILDGSIAFLFLSGLFFQ